MPPAGQPTAGLLGDEADSTSTVDSEGYTTPPKPAVGPTCIGFLNNCLCVLPMVNESLEAAHGKPIPNTEGVMEMDSLGRKNLMQDREKRKLSRPPSPVG